METVDIISEALPRANYSLGEGVVRLCRPHQWTKNLLIFMPAVAAHKLAQKDVLWQCILCFIAFCLVTSGNYVLNDLKDIQSDRKHPRKRYRPLAAGIVPTGIAIAMAICLLGIGLGVGALVSKRLLYMLVGYLFLANAYTYELKKRLLVDVMALACLYTMRPLAGSIATSIAPSEWFLAFCTFFFASLAFAKRYTELREQQNNDPTVPMPGRGYQAQDIDILRVVGPVCGFMSVFVITLFISDAKTAMMYHQSGLLWLLCPLVAYWITRVWFLAHRGSLHHDPVVFALTDSRSYFVVLLAIAVLIGATVL